MTYTLYLNGEPLEIAASNDTDARRVAGSLIERYSRVVPVNGWKLVHDRDGRTLGRGNAERHKANGWRPAHDSPLLGPF